MTRSRRSYSPEFKIDLMRRLQAGAKATVLARQNGIAPELMYAWHKKYLIHGEMAFVRGTGTPTDTDQRIADLERKVGQLTMENELLKKALNNASSISHHQKVSG